MLSFRDGGLVKEPEDYGKLRWSAKVSKTWDLERTGNVWRNWTGLRVQKLIHIGMNALNVALLQCERELQYSEKYLATAPGLKGVAPLLGLKAQGMRSPECLRDSNL